MKKIFKTLYQKWMKFVTVIGNINARVLLTVFYFVIVIPYGIVYKIFIKKRVERWCLRMGEEETLEKLRNQY